jgi:hypothetical protein
VDRVEVALARLGQRRPVGAAVGGPQQRAAAGRPAVLGVDEVDLVEVGRPGVLPGPAMIRPTPATQPWPGSVNWTAASAWAPWPTPDAAPGEVVAVASAPLAAQDAAGAGDDVAGEVGWELAEPGVDPVPADAADVLAGVVDPVAVDPDEAAAQPAAQPATARTVSAETAARRTEGWNVWSARALKGISFVTFQKTLYPLARLYRAPSVRSWGLLGFC